MIASAAAASMSLGIRGGAWKSGIPLSLHDVLDRVLILNEGDDPHLCFTLGTLKWVDLIPALYARGPTTLTKLDSTDFEELAEVTAAVALLLLGWRRDFSADPPSPTGVPSIVSGYRLIGLRNMARELSKELESVKLPPTPRLRRDRRELRRPW